MKSITAQKGIIYLVILFFPSILSAQNIPNGGFEDVIIDTEFPSQSHPINWMPFHWLVWIECFPFQSQGMLSNESNTGDFAIKMETISCQEVGNGLVHRPSGYYTGNPEMWSPEDWSLQYDNRPEYLNFSYKFHQESTDSAYVEIMLFNYDSISQGIPFIERIDTIAFSQSNIFEETDEYIEFNLPINYVSDSLPSFVSIVFSSGKKNNCTLSSCTPGTTLWVDDVSVSGGTVGLEHIETIDQEFQLYPNPSYHSFRLISKSAVQIKNVSINDYLGRELKDWLGFQEEFIVSDLPSGTYFIQIQTTKGLAVKKLIKTG